jgi:hypothetical protein
MLSPSPGHTTWQVSPTNEAYDFDDLPGTQLPSNHKFDFIAYAYTYGRIYTTGLGRVGNSTYAVDTVSFADLNQLRTSESTFPNIAFSKCSGTFPIPIRPFGIACTNNGQKIMVIGYSGQTSYIMTSNNYGQTGSWVSKPVPSSLSSLWSTNGSVSCDENFFYVLSGSALAKLSVNMIGIQSAASDWTEIDFITSSAAPNYVGGYINLRIFNLDTTNTNKLYIFAYSNTNSVEGYGGGVFTSTDTVNWTLTRFRTLSPLRYTTYIADISFANRFGNKIVVTANFNQYNNDNRRYLFYTSDLTGRTGWTGVEPIGMDRNNYYDIQSTCITRDNRYFVFDRLGSVYYTSDLTSSFTKVSTGNPEGGPYDNRLFFIDGSEYELKAYGNAAYNSPEVVGDQYAYDSYNDSYNSEGRKWTKRNLTFTSFDDTASNESVDLGFTWNYNGSAYTSFRLNTNGQLHFSVFDGGIGVPTQGDKIIANFGDLWLQPNLINVDPSVTAISSETKVTLLALRTTYAIDTADTTDGKILFSLDTQTGTQVAKWIMIKGYYTTSDVYVNLGNLEALVDNEGHRLNFGVPLSQITSFAITYLNSYVHYHRTFFPNYPITKQLDNNGHGVWTKNLSWVDGGVQHNIFRMAVICGEYGNTQRDRSYRVSLYKAGASQKISISALSKFSGFRFSRASNTDKNCGPYPFAAANSALKAQIDYTETTWYSDDNGVTWFLNNKDSTNKSTVVQMGPPLGVSSNISLNTNKLYLSAQRPNLYAATDDWYSGIFDINRNTFGYPENLNIKIGPNMGSMILRYITGERTSSVFGETQMFTAIESSYSTTVNKSTQYYQHGDINRSGSIDLSDAIDMQRIIAGLTPYDGYSISGAQRLVEYLLNNYPNNVIDAAYTYGWIAPNTTQMSSIISYYGMLPGIKDLTTSKTQNVSLLALSQLGPVYKFNVLDKIDSPVSSNYKSNYITAASGIRLFRA